MLTVEVQTPTIRPRRRDAVHAPSLILHRSVAPISVATAEPPFNPKETTNIDIRTTDIDGASRSVPITGRSMTTLGRAWMTDLPPPH